MDNPETPWRARTRRTRRVLTQKGLSFPHSRSITARWPGNHREITGNHRGGESSLSPLTGRALSGGASLFLREKPRDGHSHYTHRLKRDELGERQRPGRESVSVCVRLPLSTCRCGPSRSVRELSAASALLRVVSEGREEGESAPANQGVRDVIIGREVRLSPAPVYHPLCPMTQHNVALIFA